MRNLRLNKKFFYFLFLGIGLVILVVFTIMQLLNRGEKMIEGTLNSSGELRSYLLYVPDSYLTGNPSALVITLHGYGSNPSDAAYSSRWNALANQEGFLAVYPQGTGDPAFWHSYGGDYEMLNSDIDVQFISDLIDHMETQYNIDPTRIFVNGMSMGGGMSLVLMCKLSDRIAAVGGVAGAYSYPLEMCKPSRSVPFIAFHGTDDLVVPYNGEEISDYGFSYPSLPIFIQTLADRYQCAETNALPQDGEISSMRYSQCAQNAEIIFYTVHGGGHTWPGDPSGTTSEMGMITQQIEAAPLMWEFFERHPLPEK